MLLVRLAKMNIFKENLSSIAQNKMSWKVSKLFKENFGSSKITVDFGSEVWSHPIRLLNCNFSNHDTKQNWWSVMWSGLFTIRHFNLWTCFCFIMVLSSHSNTTASRDWWGKPWMRYRMLKHWIWLIKGTWPGAYQIGLYIH